MNVLLNVLRKEWLDVSRDRRSIMASLMFAVFGPVFLYLSFNAMGDRKNSDGMLNVAVVGAEHAPNLISYLEQHKIAISALESVDDMVFNDEQMVLVTLPANYVELYENRQTIDIAVTANFKNSKAESQASRVALRINQYGRSVDNGRLIAAGVNPTSAQTLSATTYDLSKAGGAAARISSTLIYIFLIAGFISGAFMAADSVAGERERHSLEAILAQPVSSLTLTLGKWLTSGAISMFVSTVTIVLGAVLLNRAPLDELGFRLFLDPMSIAIGAFALLPLALFAVALQMLVAARSRTYREAGTYAQFTMFLPLAVAGSLMLSNIDYGILGDILPITNQTTVLRDVFLEGKSSFMTVFVGVITTLAGAFAMVWLTAQRLSDEKSL